MDEDAKKTALRMIPYGLYVLTAESKSGAVAAATINWVTQTAFVPPLVVVGVKADSGAHAIIKEMGKFALNALGKGQQGMAFNFFKSHEREGDTIGGEPFEKSPGGVPILLTTPAWVECKLVDTINVAITRSSLGRSPKPVSAKRPKGGRMRQSCG
jgi:flavin reductase (DIM6/NTAB) family NADH-FMN oxidoreductase RutF